MSIDEIVVRKNIQLKTFVILRENGIHNYQIVDEFQDRYKAYNLRVYNLISLAQLPNRTDAVIEREKYIAIEMLKENNIQNAELYFN